MGKPYPKPKWQPRSKSDSNVEKTSKLQGFTGQVSLFKQFILDFGLIILVVSSLGLVILEILRAEVILEAIEVPEDVQKLGYTGKIVAEQLADAALEFELETRELSSKNSWKKDLANMPGIGTDTRIKDISLPGSSFTMRSIARFLRQELGLHSDYVRGEIVHEKNGLKLTLRNLSDANVPAVRLNKDNIEELIKAGGTALLQLTSPSVLAVNAYHKFESSVSKTDAEKAAIQQYQYCLKYLPTTDDALALTLWGITLENPNHPDDAIEKFRKATEVDSRYANVYNVWGNFLSHLNRHEEAIEQYRKAIEIDPKYTYVYNNLGNALHDFQRPEQAIEQFRKAIEINPKYTNAYNSLGTTLQVLKRYDEAIEQYRKAIEIDPNYVNAYNNLGTALQDLKRYDEAVEQYRKAIEINPNFAYAYYNLGNALRDLKHPEQAIEQYNKVIEIDPKYVDAYNGLGNVLSDLQRYDEAIGQYRKAIEINPNYAYVYSNLGNTLRDLKRHEQAIEQYRKAIEIDPNYVNAYYNLGVTLYDLKRYDEAIEQYHKAIKIDPKYTDACANWLSALQNLKPPHKAETDEYDQACGPSP